jgi:hypothetical protein
MAYGSGTRLQRPVLDMPERNGARASGVGVGPHAIRKCRATLAAGVGLVLLLTAAAASAQDTRLMVISGVGGDDEHTAQFHKWADLVIDGAKKSGVPEANISYLADAPEQDAAHKPLRSTKENIAHAFADVTAKSKPGDEVFILLIGHGSFDGKESAFNIPGPDLTASDFGVFLDKLAAQRIIFVNTSSSSGPFADVLKKPGRTIVTATKTGGEHNEPRFAGYFIEALESDEADRDRNGRVSVGEAFDYATAKVKDAYDKEHHIQTEHSVLEDGSQGKLAATLFLAPDKARAALAQTTDPALRALLEEQAAINRDIEALRLMKDGMDPAEYDKRFEKLATDLALKTKAIRDREAAK